MGWGSEGVCVQRKMMTGAGVSMSLGAGPVGAY
jgi:hypothetical protein